MFQKTVNRQYTTGFPGDIVRDGPQRAKPGRIDSDLTKPLARNTISRAFGWKSDEPPLGTNNPAGYNYTSLDAVVAVGGPVFYGVLGHPKHYALQGTAQGGPLAATIDLPNGFEGEFFDMATGIVVEVYNETTAAKNITYGDKLAYVPNNIDPAKNPNNLPYGAIVTYNGALPDGFIPIPNGFVAQTIQGLAASGPNNQVSTYAIVQLTQ
jgi:hypothetical protein